MVDHGPSQELDLPIHVRSSTDHNMRLQNEAKATADNRDNTGTPYQQKIRAASHMMHQHAGIRRGPNKIKKG